MARRLQVIVAAGSAVALIVLVVQYAGPVGRTVAALTLGAPRWLPIAALVAGVAVMSYWWWPRRARRSDPPELKPLQAWVIVVAGLISVAGGALAMVLYLSCNETNTISK
jgi:hypothetical protein